jgi:hypothetical protein
VLYLRDDFLLSKAWVLLNAFCIQNGSITMLSGKSAEKIALYLIEFSIVCPQNSKPEQKKSSQILVGF